MKFTAFKKILTLTLAAAMLLALCGCGISIDLGTAKATPTPVPETTATPAPTPTPVPTATPTPVPTTDPTTEAGQIKLIYANLSALSQDDDQTKYWYSVTDLDGNGRLELLCAVTQGTGSFTSGRFYEVNESYNGFTEIDLGLKEGEFLPEIIMTSTDCYKAADGTLNYAFTDTSSSGYGEVLSATMTLSLKSGKVTLKTYYIDKVTTENGYSVHSFADGNGSEISYEEFTKLKESAFSGLTKTTVNFDWFALSAASSAERLAESYGKFAGKTISLGTASGPAAPITTVAPTAAPVKTPVPAATPTPTQQIIVVHTPVVTKDPTGETLEAGKSCTFIARATDYSYMRWQLIDTYGNVFDALNNNPFQQMSVWGADGQQLTLSNVPLEMDGWSVRAVFTGNGVVYSGKAGIHVTQPKVSTPITAYPGNGSYFYDVYNTVSLYAGSGDQIHYELIRGGDTGAYDSGTVTSGQAVNVIGIYGQCLSVELYASVIGDEGNSLHAYYTVDCLPVEPTPEPYVPTPDPQINSCRGIIIDELMSTVTIDIFAGSQIQILKDFVSPAGCDLLNHECTVYYYGVDPTDTSSVYSVVVDQNAWDG